MKRKDITSIEFQICYKVYKLLQGFSNIENGWLKKNVKTIKFSESIFLKMIPFSLCFYLVIYLAQSCFLFFNSSFYLQFSGLIYRYFNHLSLTSKTAFILYPSIKSCFVSSSLNISFFFGLHLFCEGHIHWGLKQPSSSKSIISLVKAYVNFWIVFIVFFLLSIHSLIIAMNRDYVDILLRKRIKKVLWNWGVPDKNNLDYECKGGNLNHTGSSNRFLYLHMCKLFSAQDCLISVVHVFFQFQSRGYFQVN